MVVSNVFHIPAVPGNHAVLKNDLLEGVIKGGVTGFEGLAIFVGVKQIRDVLAVGAMVFVGEQIPNNP